MSTQTRLPTAPGGLSNRPFRSRHRENDLTVAQGSVTLNAETTKPEVVRKQTRMLHVKSN